MTSKLLFLSERGVSYYDRLSEDQQGVIMETLAVLALVIGLVMVFRWLGAPVRHLPGEKKSSTTSPEADIPPPNPPISMG